MHGCIWRIILTLIELSADELISTGSLAKKCSEVITLSWASLITDWSLFFSRFHMLITPDEPPEARRGCPSETSKINKLLKNKNYKHKNNVEKILDWHYLIQYILIGRRQ